LLRRTLNLGIVAHVDAGKTTLTERLLYAAGVIDEVGSVDAGTTQTDSLVLEQQRGITIKSAVASFAIDDVTVNLIDTPGHPDFIAEVERVLNVLDGVVLVIAAVEGVQAQTRVLMRALQRLRIPTLMFVNKIDRRGAECERVLREISARLTPATIAMGSVSGEGTPTAAYVPHSDGDAAFTSQLVDVLAEHDEALLAAYVADETSVSPRHLRDALAAQTAQVLVHPVFFGSALSGAGVESLTAGITELLPVAAGDAGAPVSASVFKVERGAAGDKVAYARLFSGRIRVRDRLRFRRDGAAEDEEAKVTAIGAFDGAAVVPSASVVAGGVAKLWGLRPVQIGDVVGEPPSRAATRGYFAPPTLESVVVPRRVDDKAALYVALTQLAEQDPLINVRRDDDRQQISVSLYGEVQKEVIQATLEHDFRIEVEFRETTPIYIERPVGPGEALEILRAESNPFLATIGLRVDPAPPDSGIDFRLDIDPRTAPLYLYKTIESFAEHMDQYVRGALREGLFGWQVTDCVVTMTRCTYSVPDGPPSRSGPLSTAADFRHLTPLVLVQALERAGTVVCEPIVRVTLEIPTQTLGAVLSAVARLGAAAETQSLQTELSTIETAVPVTRVQDLRRQLPGLTGGEGVLESSFGGYEPVRGEPPTRRRTTPNPLNLAEYMMHLARRVGS
jgi:ribosomal protection tetracycline resistance protein